MITPRMTGPYRTKTLSPATATRTNNIPEIRNSYFEFVLTPNIQNLVCTGQNIGIPAGLKKSRAKCEKAPKTKDRTYGHPKGQNR